MILKYRAVPAKKDPSHDSELQTVSETASNVCFVFIRHSSARHSLALPKARFQEIGIFSKRIVKLYFSFIDMIKQKKIGGILRMPYYSIEWVLKINMKLCVLCSL